MPKNEANNVEVCISGKYNQKGKIICSKMTLIIKYYNNVKKEQKNGMYNITVMITQKFQ